MLREQGLVDECRLWVNTCDSNDLEYIDQLASPAQSFFHTERLSDPKPEWRGNRRVRLIREFFRNCIEPDTVYIRMDDDICWVDPCAVRTLVDFRLDHPEYFLVYPGIVNNGFTATIHGRMGLIPLELGHFRSWQRSPLAGVAHHQLFLDALHHGDVSTLEFGQEVMAAYEQAPINCVAWLGADFARFEGRVAESGCDELEEVWLTKIKPRELGRPNCMYGRAMVAHFAFNKQRVYLEDKTSLLEVYEQLSLDVSLGRTQAART
ncbi:MAG: hypothetical protein JSS66_05040 [Armatimonadetes bacterium]|nr:hypothetical protein [Armatimonadota bacterium]